MNFKSSLKECHLCGHVYRGDKCICIQGKHFREIISPALIILSLILAAFAVFFINSFWSN